MDYEQLRIYGNEIVFKGGIIDEFKMMINSVGKSLVFDAEKVGNRRNLIIMGDILADVNMAENVPHDTLISIGFLNKPKNLEKDLKDYLGAYDVVILNDGSFEEPMKIFQEIFSDPENGPKNGENNLRTLGKKD